MKICVISFDFWNYDAHIVEVLRKKGITANHINIGAYQHKNLGAKIINAFSKIFLKKNIKNIKRQKFILEELKKIGKQDQILIINPELIEHQYHQKIKNFTNRYIAYLYDSLARCPAEHLLYLFDEVFSFDKNDVEKHGFKMITNYNYLTTDIQINKIPKYDLIYLASFDNRLKIAERISKRMKHFGLHSHMMIVGKKYWKKKYFGKKSTSFFYTKKRIPHEKIAAFYEEGRAILDLVRDNQDGLSFRIFEAMALKKKIITNNKTISEYDFYNPNNIMILNEGMSNLNKSFFETPYEEIQKEIYNRYTIDGWVDIVFELDNKISKWES